jgi:hypothetical protein
VALVVPTEDAWPVVTTGVAPAVVNRANDPSVVPEEFVATSAK